MQHGSLFSSNVNPRAQADGVEYVLSDSVPLYNPLDSKPSLTWHTVAIGGVTMLQTNNVITSKAFPMKRPTANYKELSNL